MNARALTAGAERLRRRFAESGTELTPEQFRERLWWAVAAGAVPGACSFCGQHADLRMGICAACFRTGIEERVQ